MVEFFFLAFVIWLNQVSYSNTHFFFSLLCFVDYTHGLVLEIFAFCAMATSNMMYGIAPGDKHGFPCVVRGVRNPRSADVTERRAHVPIARSFRNYQMNHRGDRPGNTPHARYHPRHQRSVRTAKLFVWNIAFFSTCIIRNRNQCWACCSRRFG